MTLEYEREGRSFHRSLSTLGTVSILERTIIEILCAKIGVKLDEKGPIVFAEWVKKLRKIYNEMDNSDFTKRKAEVIDEKLQFQSPNLLVQSKGGEDS